MTCNGNATPNMASSLGGDTAHHACMQSLLTAAAGLTGLGASISPRNSPLSPIKNKASMESNQSENHPAASAALALAASIPPISKKSLLGFGNVQAAFTHFSQDATMAVDQFFASGQISVTNSAAIDAAPPAHASNPQGREAPLLAPASPSKLPGRDPVDPVAGASKSFPETLLEVLSSGEHPEAVAWLPHGRGFVILNKEQFLRAVLPRYFDGAKYSSFTRRMKRWGFERVPRCPEMGAYYHREFLRDWPELVKEMRYGARGKFGEGTKNKKQKEGAVKLRKLAEKAAEKQVQISLPKKVPGQLKSEAHVHVLQSQAEYSPPHALSEHMLNARKNTAWLKNQADLLRPSTHIASSFPFRLPDSGAPIDPRERRIAEVQQELLDTREQRIAKKIVKIQRELLLNQSMLSREVADCLARGSGATSISTARARARSSADGGVSNQWPCGAPTSYAVQRMIDVERAERILEAKNIPGLCIRRSPAPTGRGNDIGATMASKVLVSSKIHANIMDAVARDLYSRPKPALPAAVPSMELWP